VIVTFSKFALGTCDVGYQATHMMYGELLRPREIRKL
jgi:hypothetical protein